jgi:hypothetical protein
LFLLIFLVIILLLASPLIIGLVLIVRNRAKAGSIVLGVYAAFVGAFLVYAQFERRSTSGHIFRWIKGENGAHQHVNDLAEDVKEVVDPSELQHWAVSILQETPQATSQPSISKDKVPASIRNLTSGPSPLAGALCDPGSVQDRSVWLVWGGGLDGRWGIRVGSPTFKIVPTPDDNYYIEWKPGIYFWCETH